MAKTYETKDTTKRTHLVGAKLSDDELARFRFICDRLNITQSEYIREAILTAKVTRPTVVTAMDRDTAKELLAHFGKIGSNLNQIARVLNQGYQADTGIIKEIRNCIQQMLRGTAVLEAVGG